MDFLRAEAIEKMSGAFEFSTIKRRDGRQNVARFRQQFTQVMTISRKSSRSPKCGATSRKF
jgi:hypothetical protein